MNRIRFHIFWYVFTFVYFVNVHQTAADGNSSDSECSNHCSQQDPDDSCWIKTERYYDKNLVNALNDWLAVEINIDQWNKRAGQENPPANSTEVAVNRISQYFDPALVLDVEHLREVVASLLNLTYTRSASVIPIGIPEFVCPIPADYDSRLWMYLFVASVLVNIAMLLVVVPFIVKSERRDKKLYSKQISTVQMLKPSSINKSRTPSAS